MRLASLMALIASLCCLSTLARAEPETPPPTPPASPITAAPAPAAPHAGDERGVAHPVEVQADMEDFTWLTVGDYTCRLPCRMRLYPGVYPVIASGKLSYSGHLEMADGPMTLELKDAATPYRIAGGVMVPFGLLMAASMWSLALLCDSNACEMANLVAWPVVGGVTLFTGVGLLAYAAGRQLELRPVGRAEYSRLFSPRVTGVALAPVRGGGASLALAMEF